MEAKLNKLSSCERELEIEIPKSEYDAFIENKYAEVIPNIEIKGFRKGKVPFKLIQKLYGASIEHDAINDAADSNFKEYITNNKLFITNQPALSHFEVQGDKAIFKFTFETLPDIELQEYKGVTINEYFHPVEETEIDKLLLDIKFNGAETEEAELIDAKNFVVDISITEIDKESNLPLVESTKQTTVFLESEKFEKALIENILNKKVGDSFIFTPQIANTQLEEDIDLKTFNITITKAQIVKYPEMTPEFIKSVVNKDLQTEEELREELGFYLQDQWDKKCQDLMRQDIINTMVDMHDFEVPAGLFEQVKEEFKNKLKKEYGKEFANNPNEELLDNLVEPMAKRQIKWDILSNAIIDKEKIEVDDDTIDDIIHSLSPQGIPDAQMATMREMVKNNENIISTYKTNKLFELIIDFAKTNEVKLDINGHPIKNEDELNEETDTLDSDSNSVQEESKDEK